MPFSHIRNIDLFLFTYPQTAFPAGPSVLLSRHGSLGVLSIYRNQLDMQKNMNMLIWGCSEEGELWLSEGKMSLYSGELWEAPIFKNFFGLNSVSQHRVHHWFQMQCSRIPRLWMALRAHHSKCWRPQFKQATQLSTVNRNHMPPFVMQRDDVALPVWRVLSTPASDHASRCNPFNTENSGNTGTS